MLVVQPILTLNLFDIAKNRNPCNGAPSIQPRFPTLQPIPFHIRLNNGVTGRSVSTESVVEGNFADKLPTMF